MLAGQDLLVILVIILVIFGGNRISELGSGLGKGIRNFKKGMAEDDETTPKKLEDKSGKGQRDLKEASGPEKGPILPPAETSTPSEVEDNLEKIDEAKGENALQPIGQVLSRIEVPAEMSIPQEFIS